VFASLLVLGTGLAAGLTAYYLGFSTSAFSSQGGPDELVYVPRDAAVVAFADVQDVMDSELRRRLKAALHVSENGQEEFQSKTGINIETDIDRVVACIGAGSAVHGPQTGMVIANGRFDTVKIESLMREHGAEVQDYKGKRVLVSTEAMRKQLDPDSAQTPPSADTDSRPERIFALAFIKPGTIAVGSSELVHRAIDLENGGDNITTNEEVMELVRSLDGGNNAWAVGHFDALHPRTKLPESVASQIPAITLFSASAHINGGVEGLLRAEARDDEAANNLRDVIRGLLALGKLQTGGKPEVQAMMQSLELGGTGRTVALSFTVPAEIFDMIDRTRSEQLDQNLNR
jgi:hypothetical protein